MVVVVTVDLSNFVAAFHSCTAFHPFSWAIDSLIRFVHISETRWATSIVSEAILVILVWVFCVVALVAFLCWFAVFSAGETQIWPGPGDFRVVAVLPGFCLFYLLYSASLYEARRFIPFAISLTASLTVRTEP